MKKLFTLISFVIAAFSYISDQLAEKYSISFIKPGNKGTEPNIGDEVWIHYDGTLIDGTKFDSSYDRGQPISIKIG